MNPFSVMKIIESYFGLPKGSMVKRCRSKTTAIARTLCMKVLRDKYHLSYNEIGDSLNRDHSTVIKNLKRIDVIMDNNRHGYIKTLYSNLLDIV